MYRQLINYPRAATATFRKSQVRPKSKRPKARYTVERVSKRASAQNAKASRSIELEGIVDPNESCILAMSGMVFIGGKQYQLVKKFVFKRELQEFGVRTSFDDVIDDDGIDFEKLEARLERLKSTTRGLETTNADTTSPASFARSVKAKGRVTGVKKNGPSNPAAMVLTITGYVMELGDTVAELEWFGGETLRVNRERMFGNWGDLKSGDWFKAVILRLPNGEVTQAILQSKINPLRYLSAAELEEFYSRIKPAELTPLE